MEITNRQLGKVVVKDDTILTLREGLLGFEELKRLALIETEGLAPFQWLVAVEEPELAFAVISPHFVAPQFEVEMTPEDEEALDYRPEDPLAFLVIVNVRDFGVTANLRGPVVINGRNRLARQLVLHHTDYKVDHPIGDVTDSEEGIAAAMEGANARTHSSAG